MSQFSLRQPTLSNIQDPAIRSAIQWIKDYIFQTQILDGQFQFFEFTFTKAETDLLIPHNLGFLPKDIIQTSLTGGNTLTWNYDDFTSTNLSVTTSGACVVRFFAGQYSI